MLFAMSSVYAQEYYVGFGGGASYANKKAAPVASVRVGIDTDWLIAEVEASYLSVSTNGYQNCDKDRASEILFGGNFGVKFVNSYKGYLALALNTGYALQEEMLEYYHDCYHNYDRPYRGKMYVGASLKGNVYLSDNISLWGEARYQSLPLKKKGLEWAPILQAGIAFYF